jgi:UDP-N-acetylmuramoyl-tripeptide--D-alanyl-D-alanine ligase
MKYRKQFQIMKPTNNRSQIIKTENNTLILDAYNANPSSMRSALDSFEMVNNFGKVLILGDMYELGNDSNEEHLRIIQHALELKIPTYFVGSRFNEFKKYQSNQQLFFETKNELFSFLSKNKLKDKMILMKGSRGVGLETLVEVL